MPAAPLSWLIVEDSLESRTGHWFEYLDGFDRELRGLGDRTAFLVSRRAAAFITGRFSAQPVLPASIFLRASDGAGPLRRLARLPWHATQTWAAARRHLRTAADGEPDVIFVPTVMVHHLLAWVRLVKGRALPPKARLLLFFPNLPLRAQADGSTVADGSLTSRLLGRLLRQLRPEVSRGRVILGVETHAMQRAAAAAFGVPFAYLPHPVPALPGEGSGPPAARPVLAAYGAARHEKGSDLLAAAIARRLAEAPDSPARFVLQWPADFAAESGQPARLPAPLRDDPRVEIVGRLFGEGEYGARLAAADALLLPYRISSYALRVSRVAIEAMVNGKPILATRDTTLAGQMAQYGAGVTCADGDVPGIAAALGALERDFAGHAAAARRRMAAAREHFSVATFRRLLGDLPISAA